MSEEDEPVSLDLQGLLNSWNLGQYFQNFKDNAVDIDGLDSLLEPSNEKQLDKLVPVMGHSLHLKKQIKKLQEMLLDSNANVLSVSSAPSSEITDDFDVDEFLNTVAGSSEVDPKEASLPHTPVSATLTTVEQQNSRKRPLTSTTKDAPESSTSVPCAERTPAVIPRKQPRVSEGDKQNKVRNILNRSGYGRGILAVSRTSSKIKAECDRNKLCELVIDNLVTKETNYKLKSEVFVDIVEDIREIFPEELEATYYIPYRKNGNVKCLAKGKLIQKYQTLRKYLRGSGEITSEGTEGDDGAEDEEALGAENLEDKLNYLRQNLDDWGVISEYWRDTSKYRVRCLRTTPHLLSKSKKPKKGEETSAGTVAAYVALFPCLRDVNGYQLFIIDFDLEYPNHKNAIFSGWDNFIAKSLKALKEIKKPCPALSDSLLMLEDEIYEKETTDLIVVLNLGYLDSVVTVTRMQKDKKFTTWRPPHPEIQEGLISLVETDGKLETFILNRFLKFEGWKLPFQPFCVAVGSNVSDITKFVVVLDKTTKFQFNSAQRALDVCFKVLHASHARYSDESYRLWMLIQLKLYNLETAYDNVKSDTQLPKLLEKFA